MSTMTERITLEIQPDFGLSDWSNYGVANITVSVNDGDDYLVPFFEEEGIWEWLNHAVSLYEGFCESYGWGDDDETDMAWRGQSYDDELVEFDDEYDYELDEIDSIAVDDEWKDWYYSSVAGEQARKLKEYYEKENK